METIKEAIQKLGLEINFNEDNYDAGIANGFQQGAEWALNNQWINVSEELPHENHRNKGFDDYSEEVICQSANGSLFLCYTHRINGRWEWYGVRTPKYWMPIPKINK